jgi:multidrug efflux pump subunit AcrB
LKLEPAASIIDRYQGQRINTIRGYLMPFDLPAAAVADFNNAIERADFALPAGYRIEFGGEQERRQESVSKLISTFVIFLVAMAAVIVLSLNSFRQAAIIAFVGVASVGLALFGVRLFGYPLGFTALIGTLGLVGLAINGAIIVLAALKADPLAAAGDVDASAEVVIDATRHILSTTATTIGGFVPLILFGGTFWPPLATAIAGGVAGSAIIALYTVPTLYRRIGRRAAPHVTPEDPIVLHGVVAAPPQSARSASNPRVANAFNT